MDSFWNKTAKAAGGLARRAAALAACGILLGALGFALADLAARAARPVDSIEVRVGGVGKWAGSEPSAALALGSAETAARGKDVPAKARSESPLGPVVPIWGALDGTSRRWEVRTFGRPLLLAVPAGSGPEDWRADAVVGTRPAGASISEWDGTEPSWSGPAGADIPKPGDGRRFLKISVGGSDAFDPAAFLASRGEHPVLDAAVLEAARIGFPAACALLLLWCVRSFRPAPPLPSSHRPWTTGIGGREEARGEGPAWAAAALACCLACLWIVFGRDPFHFTQDDGLTQFLPVMSAACSELSAGRFPAWEPGLLGGIPVASSGIYAATYPGTWLSCAASRALFGSDAHLLNIFAAFHILAGCALSFAAARRLGLSGPAAFCAAAALPCSGFLLTTGRGWFSMIPYAAFLPAVLLGLSLCADPGRRGRGGGVLLLAASVGGAAHAGNPQMWAYLCVFAAALALLGRPDGRTLRTQIAGLLLGLAAAAPIVWCSLDEAAWSESVRAGGGGLSLDGALSAFLLPLPLGEGPAVMATHTGAIDRIYEAARFFGGGLPADFGLGLGLWALARRLSRRSGDPTGGAEILACAGCGVLLLSFWRDGGIGLGFWALPGLDRLRHPYKLLPFALLLLPLAGAMKADLLVRSGAIPKGILQAAAVLSGLLVLHAGAVSKSGHFLFAVESAASGPRPSPEGGIRAPDEDAGKILAISPARPFAEGWMAAGAWNGALSIGTAAVGGYDWIAASKPEARSAASAAAGIPTDALPRDDIRLHLLRDKGFLLHPDLAAEAGAAEIVFFDGLERPMERLLSGAGTDPAAWAAEWTSEIRREGIRDIAKLKAPGRIWRIDGGGGISALRISDAAASGLHLAFVASDRPRRLSAALLPTAGLTARVGGKGVPISPDGAFRSFVEIPAGAVGLDLLYSDEGWAKGGALAGLLLLSAALLLFGGRIFDGRIADGRQTSTPPSGGGTKSNVADTTEEVE